MRAPGAVLARVLDVDEHGVVAVVDHGAAGLGVAGDGEELLDAAALGAVEGDLVQRVGVADGAGLAVGGDPEVALGVERQVVRAGDRGDLLLRVAGEVGRGGDRRVAGEQQDDPGEGGGGVIPAPLGDLDDVAVAVADDRVGLVHGGALGVVGQGRVDLAGDRVGLDVLRTVHLGGAHLVCREAGVDEDLGQGHARDEGRLLVGQGDPLAGAVEGAVRGQGAPAVDLGGRGVAGELGHVEGALVHQAHVVLLVALADLLGRDELVQVVVALVVAGVDHGVAGRGDHGGAGLVLEAAQEGVLHGRGGRVLGVDLDDPAEAVGLVLVAGLGQVEAVVDLLPAAAGGGGGDAVALLLGRAAALEVLVEVLLAGEHGAPRGGAAGAVVQGAQHAGAGRVLDGLEQRVAGGRAADLELGGAGDAAVAAAAADVLPRGAALGALEVHDGQAVGLEADVDDVLEVRGDVLRGEHDVLVGVLVVGDEVAGAVVAAVGDDVQVVVVVAELGGLRRTGLVLDVELRGVGEQRVAPADHGAPVVALRHGHGVHGAAHRRDGLEGELAAAGRAPAVVRERLGGLGHLGADDDGGGETGAADQGGAARDGGLRDLLEGRVRRGVGHRVGARVAALELARDGGAVATGVAGHGEEALQHDGVLRVVGMVRGPVPGRRRPRGETGRGRHHLGPSLRAASHAQVAAS